MTDPGMSMRSAAIDSEACQQDHWSCGRLAKQIEGARAVELRAWNAGQIECIGSQVGEITIADGLRTAIAAAVTAGAAECAVEAVQIASGLWQTIGRYAASTSVRFTAPRYCWLMNS